MLTKIRLIVCFLLVPLACFATTASADIRIHRDIAYVPNAAKSQTLDIYLPKDTTKAHPVLVFVHGGGWSNGDKRRSQQHGRFYAKRNIAFVSVNYRLSPGATHPAHVEDCAAALAWVYKKAHSYNFNLRRVFLSGHSAGAHLAALVATDLQYLGKHGIRLSRIAGVIPVDTASFDLSKRGGGAFEQRLVGKRIAQAFGKDLRVLKNASPLVHAAAGGRFPPFLILVSGERSHAVKQSKQLAQALRRAGGAALVREYAGYSHREMNKRMSKDGDPLAQAVLQFIRQ